jgi:hypothetical protein
MREADQHIFLRVCDFCLLSLIHNPPAQADACINRRPESGMRHR